MRGDGHEAGTPARLFTEGEVMTDKDAKEAAEEKRNEERWSGNGGAHGPKPEGGKDPRK
jgi:hypothetical protein